NQLWVARYNGPGNSYDLAHALAVDGAGNVYVTGYSLGAGTREDYATIKYGSNGNQLWLARYNGPGNEYDYANALAVDAAGNVYVTGESYGGENDFDYATIKYDSNGNQLWVARYDGPGNDLDLAWALAVDGAGSVYVTGSSVGAGTFSDYATIKYDSNGNELWVARYNGPGNNDDSATALAVDGAGNVYVTGSSYGPGTFYDYATIKYDSNGNQVWLARYNGTGNGNDFASALTVDGAGNVYVTGGSQGVGPGPDYATIKYVQNAVLPHALNIFRGRLISGGLQQLLQSDDQRLVVAPGPVFTNSQSPIHIIIDGTAPSGSLSELRFALEGHTTSTNVEQRIELYNFLESAYETVDLRPSTTSDSLAEVSITNNPKRFVQSGTRLMRTRMRYKANGPIFTYPWQARLDHTYWTIFP
nr:SBBP repeat-containing protein [Armatimonadota bacterium]